MIFECSLPVYNDDDGEQVLRESRDFDDVKLDLFLWDDRVESGLLAHISWEPRWRRSLQHHHHYHYHPYHHHHHQNQWIAMLEPVGTQEDFEETRSVAPPSSEATQGSQVGPDIIVIMMMILMMMMLMFLMTKLVAMMNNDDLSQRGVGLRYGRYPAFQ